MSWSPWSWVWPSGRGPPSLLQERLGAGSPLPWSQLKLDEYIFVNVCVLTKHTNASSEFSVRVKWLLLGFPRIDTFGGAEKIFSFFIFYLFFLSYLFGVKTHETQNTHNVFLFSTRMFSNVCWWAELDREGVMNVSPTFAIIGSGKDKHWLELESRLLLLFSVFQ